ncbi:hypothetical protein B0H63DRAFT_473090 [Podospora didyma]|uniref:Uncharacterized protein n=1 Tax=Podospora didyma TaxID=330526 RepID=A0AAE0NPW1_9PEZI|nr:hypothetical protein B0H63DRAFT_473090 [Podospora didyma]
MFQIVRILAAFPSSLLSQKRLCSSLQADSPLLTHPATCNIPLLRRWIVRPIRRLQLVPRKRKRTPVASTPLRRKHHGASAFIPPFVPQYPQCLLTEDIH